MVEELRNRFRASFIMSDAPMPITSVSELLADIQSRPAWDGASISAADADYPRVHLDWHEGHGFVFQTYEDDESWSDFLVTTRISRPLQSRWSLAGKRSNDGRANYSCLRHGPRRP
jgi:hypothetical protein